MMTKTYVKRVAMFIALAMALGGASAAAQTYPSRPIQVIIPFAGGSASDVVTRILLERAGRSIGQPFIIDNRPGAGGNTGTLAAAKSTPDGYTLVGSGSGPIAANPTLYHDLGYDPEKDFEPVAMIAAFTNVVVASTKLPVKTLADLIAGTVPLGFQWLPNVLAPLNSGGARALAVAGKTRMAALPDVPTSAEAGLPEYQASGWFTMLAPHGTPKPIVARLNQELNAALVDPAVRERLTEQGAEAVIFTPDELRTYIAAEIVKWRDIINRAGIPPIQ